MRIVSLNFDDGFTASSIRTAEIFEKYGLRTTFNIIATGHEKAWWDAPGPVVPMGDFGLWNELQSRGHEVMPHGYRHANKASLPFDESRDLILKCLDIFDRKLTGFDRRKAVFCFPYSASTPELEAWLPTVVRAFRGGNPATAVNPVPTRQTTAIRTESFGPGDCADHLNGCVEAFLQKPQDGWFVYTPHGMDAEGWGPLNSGYLERLLERLVAMPSIKVWPIGQTLAWADGGK